MPRYVYSRSLADDLSKNFSSRESTCLGWAEIKGDQAVPISNAPWLTPSEPCAAPRALSGLSLDAPTRPGTKLICAARNYKKHAKELNNAIPEEPLVFLKASSSIIGPEEPILLPEDQSSLVHHEGELALVISKRARRIRASEAHEYIFGYTLLNDVTARDLQRRDGCFTRAKSFDTFAPIGPWIDSDFCVSDQPLRVYVNDTLRQDGRLNEMLFDVPTLLSWVSQIMTLEPGDIIATGTPAGVGVLLPNDTIRVEIEGLGVLSNPVRARG